ncbi:hypothetical protein [Streptomyces yunnanensis]|nr:hypothetical protein [Streptomyces yunnanensis]
MRWTWDDLQATPAYVRRYVLDFLGLIAEQEQEQNDRAQREANRAQRMG